MNNSESETPPQPDYAWLLASLAGLAFGALVGLLWSILYLYHRGFISKYSAFSCCLAEESSGAEITINRSHSHSQSHSHSHSHSSEKDTASVPLSSKRRLSYSSVGEALLDKTWKCTVEMKDNDRKSPSTSKESPQSSDNQIATVSRPVPTGLFHTRGGRFTTLTNSKYTGTARLPSHQGGGSLISVMTSRMSPLNLQQKMKPLRGLLGRDVKSLIPLTLDTVAEPSRILEDDVVSLMSVQGLSRFPKLRETITTVDNASRCGNSIDDAELPQEDVWQSPIGDTVCMYYGPSEKMSFSRSRKATIAAVNGDRKSTFYAIPNFSDDAY